ncbi:MAG: hypothetical protein KOO66_11255 [Bacteroidales bacterium]|nr:hypothetical protein [Bacteroidales bacterium]
MKYITIKHRAFRHFLTAPLIFGAIIPIAILDLYIEIYHRFSFPFYRIPYVKRRNYVKIDRHKLSYLKPGQKINCIYCGYSNGVFHYWVKILAETEKYFCSVKHKEDKNYIPPEHHKEFIDYSDKETFDKEYGSKRTPFL